MLKEELLHIIWFSNFYVKKQNLNPKEVKKEDLDQGVQEKIDDLEEYLNAFPNGFKEGEGFSEKKLWLKNLRKVYTIGRTRNKKALENITFGLEGGECLSVLGVNGAGKTTML